MPPDEEVSGSSAIGQTNVGLERHWTKMCRIRTLWYKKVSRFNTSDKLN